MKVCSKCNFRSENDNAKFCKKCGCPFPKIATTSDTEPAIRIPDDDGGILLKSDQQSHLSIRYERDVPQGVTIKGYGSSDNDKKKQTGKGIMWAVKTCFRKYATFKGRASRPEYWYFALFNTLFVFILLLLAVIINQNVLSSFLIIIAGFYSLASIIPGLSVTIRRLHDSGLNGYFYLILIVPFIGAFILLCLMCKASDKGRNIYGYPS